MLFFRVGYVPSAPVDVEPCAPFCCGLELLMSLLLTLPGLLDGLPCTRDSRDDSGSLSAC